MNRVLKSLCIVFALTPTVSVAGGYIGLTKGQADLELPGFDDGDSFSLLAGLQINKNVAIEAAYLDLGESDDDIPPVWTIEADGLTLAGVASAPLNDSFSLFGRLGILMWDVSLDEDGFGELASDDGNDLFIGFGCRLSAAEQLDITLQYDMYELDDVDVDNLAFGVRLKF